PRHRPAVCQAGFSTSLQSGFPTIEAGAGDAEIPASLANVTNLLGMPKNTQLALNIALVLVHGRHPFRPTGPQKDVSQVRTYLQIPSSSPWKDPCMTWTTWVYPTGLSSKHQYPTPWGSLFQRPPSRCSQRFRCSFVETPIAKSLARRSSASWIMRSTCWVDHGAISLKGPASEPRSNASAISCSGSPALRKA